MAGTTKRVATVVWSISIAVVLLVLTTSVMLPSTKPARISFDEDERAAATPTAEVISNPTTQPATVISSSKVAILKFDAPTTAPESQPHISSSKSMVFRIEPPASTTKPAHIFGSKAAVFDIDKTGILPTDDVSATQPSTAPSR